MSAATAVAMTTLTSTETATLLDVHPSTVKRWCNDGELPSEFTDGGHRRLRIDRVVDFARGRGIRTILTPFHPYEPHVWAALVAIRDEHDFSALHTLALQWARRGDFERVEQLYIALGRSDLLKYCEFCDFAVRGLLQAVGREWEAGRMRAGDEHMVSQAMAGALLALRREWLDGRPPESPADRPVAVVGSMEGNQHHLGALCVRILLERLGWTVFYPGADVPIEDFGIIQMSREASLVCISLPTPATLGDVTRSLSVLREFYDRARPYRLVFGGSDVASVDGGAVAGPFTSISFLQGCHELLGTLGHGSNGPKPRDA